MSGRDTWLAIDTATGLASVATIHPKDKNGIFGAVDIVDGARLQPAALLPKIDDVLKRSQRRCENIAGIVIGDGPGSFTGLRVGWATAKGLAHESDVPVIAIPSMMGLAAACSEQGGSVPIAVCYDALRGAVYGAIYRFEEDRVDTLFPPQVVTMEEFAKRAPLRPDIVVGDGALRYAVDVNAWIGRNPVDMQHEYEHAELDHTARWLLILRERVGAGRLLDDLATAEPTYGRPAEAQAKWEARHGRALPHPPGTSG